MYLPGQPDLASRLRQPDVLLVACLCAQWCGTCREYQDKFGELATRLPRATFVWVDIEDEPDLLGDEDIENFPTLLVQDASGVRFYGTMLPHIGHLEKLLASVAADPGAHASGPDLLAALRED
ncbi:thioredoxin family protein [Verticiella sediminum]|uniref:Thioredoxin family protein n=1 Tax=Verticiella sediminum TaxID=1247510 RepID=A0A556A997_9BURK|nr:thioredoxin family protein [Verticiella sediminum]TSH89467.1 thioredoxin family protein [Verticiella sediminum]